MPTYVTAINNNDEFTVERERPEVNGHHLAQERESNNKLRPLEVGQLPSSNNS